METTIVAPKKSSKSKWRIVPFEKSVAGHPILSKEYLARNPLPADEVYAGTGKKLWWNCLVTECRHQYRATGNSRVNGTGCPACAGRVVTPTNNLAFCFPNLAKEYSGENPIPASKIYAYSHKKVEWNCLECKHTWWTSVKNRTRNQSGCPKCFEARRIKRNNHQATVKEKVSFAQAYPHLLAEYANKNDVPADKLILDEKDPLLWWDCQEAGHLWQARLSARLHDDLGCPECYLAKPKNKVNKNSPVNI